MTVNVTQREVELHAAINAQVQLQHPHLTPAQLTWLDDGIWKFIVTSPKEDFAFAHSIYSKCNDYATYILQNKNLAYIYDTPINKHCHSLNIIFYENKMNGC